MSTIDRVEHDSRLNDSPALVAALLAHADLYAKGWSNAPQLNGSAEVLRYMVGDTVVGFLTWTPDQDEAVWWIEMAWTDPAHRLQGIHKALWKELVKLAQEHDIRRIDGGAHVENTAMNIVMRRENRRPSYQWYSYDVPRT